MKKGWYFAACGDFSWTIRHSSKIEPEWRRVYDYGPFETFSEAKKHLLQYFQSDYDEVRQTIRDIRAYRKPTK